MTTVSTITAKLILEASNYKKGLDEAGKETKEFTEKGKTSNKGLGESFEKVTGFSFGMAGAAAFAGVAIQQTAKFLNECEQAANDSNIVMAKQVAILEASGYAAGLTGEQLADMAESASKVVDIDDELIADAQSMLLTFRNIKGEGDIFERAQNAALDMQTTFGGLLDSAKQVGMALNDFGGYTKLQRSGVTFSDEQIKQIAAYREANDLLGYQKLLLEEIEKQVGGTAAAMAAASDGTARLAISTENLKEEIGDGLVPLKRSWNDFWADAFDSMAEAQAKTNEQRQAMEELGITWVNSVGYIQDGTKITYDQAQAAIEAQIELDKHAEAIEGVAEAALDAGVATEEMNQKSKDMLSITAGLTSSEQKDRDGMEKLTKKLEDGTISQQEFEDGARELASEVEMATNKILLSYTQQLLAADGLTQQEVEFLLEKGEQWGIYSATAIEQMRSLMTEAEKLTASYKSIPTEITTTITTIYRSYTESAVATYKPTDAGSQAYQEVAKNRDLNGNGVIGKATGGQTIARQLYEVLEGGNPEILTVNHRNFLMMGDEDGFVSPAYENTAPNNTRSDALMAELIAMITLLPGTIQRAVRQEIKHQ